MIDTTGEVRYAMPCVGMGVRFLHLKPEDHATIDGLVTGSGPLPPLPIQEPLSQNNQESETLLSGNLIVMSIFDIIHMIDNSRFTGKLIIKSSTAEGEIYFNTGQLAGARTGPLTGLEALDRFLTARNGTFEFKQSSGEYERTIQGTSNTALLIALLKARDETNRPVS